jgi:peptide chain release factor subunit 3
MRAQALLHYYDKKTGRKSKRPPQFAKKGPRTLRDDEHPADSCTGQKVVALMETAQPICVEKFENVNALGRFTLRDEGTLFGLVLLRSSLLAGRTIAIGKIIKLVQGDETSAQMAAMAIATATQA